ncbi:MAG: hypothetical protein ACREH4_11840 [Vitreimonas sp.]
MLRRSLPGTAIRAVLCAALALLAATPALAQGGLSAGLHAALERVFGAHIDSALDLCITDAAPDVAAFEARAAERGWPPFQNNGGWRMSTLPPGEDVHLILTAQIEPITDASIPGVAFSCSLLAPWDMASMLRAHLADKFGTERASGAFHLENGDLREWEGAPPEGGVPQVFAETPPSQRLVVLTMESRQEGVAARISVLHRTE